MEHLSEDRLLHLLLDDAHPRPEEEQHLAVCPTCQGRYTDYQALLQDLDLSRRSRPTPQALARYYQLFHEIPRTGLVRRAAQALTAWVLGLDFDSRQAALGVRRAAAELGYRLLYTGEAADLEIYVEPVGELRRLEGEILLKPGQEQIEGPFWIELRPTATQNEPERPPRPIAVTVSRPDGYFRFPNLRPGRYRLTLIPTQGPVMAPWIEVSDLDIT